MKKTVKYAGSLRKRWLVNTVGVVLTLGIVCVLAVTASFSAYYYSNMEADLRSRAKTTNTFLSSYGNMSYNEYYQSCITYVKSFEYRNQIELQMIDRKSVV